MRVLNSGKSYLDIRSRSVSCLMEPPGRYGRRYIDICYDFNFKHVFGGEEGRDLRIDLLNSLLEGRKTFSDVRLGPTERQGAQERTRKARFDLQCTGDGGEQILLEMQRKYQENFFGRQEFYALLLGSQQIPAGKEGDNFPMPEIYSIAILDFDIWRDMGLPVEMQTESINSFDLRHIKTGYPYPQRLELMLVELRKFNKGIDELKTRADKWLYLFKNLPRLTEPIFTDDPIFRKLFQLTEYDNLNQEDRKMIIDYEREERRKANSWKQQGMEEGLARGRMEGQRKGRMEKELFVVQTLIRSTDFDDQRIAWMVGVKEDFVKKIRTRNY